MTATRAFLDMLSEMHHRELSEKRIGTIVLDRETCDWVIDEEADTAICRQHGEICDGVKSTHFPGGGKQDG